MYKHFSLFFVLFFFIGCGGGSSGTTSESDPSSIEVESLPSLSTTTATSAETNPSSNSALKVAVNNTGTIIKKSFNEFVLQIIVSEPLLESEETSNSTIAVYGTVNGNATNSLLKLNTNYVGKTISVAVFKDERLVAQSETFKVNNREPINFGEITIK